MARLTAGQRKRLPKGDFAGPNRSYPVPDKAHARVAKSFAARYASPDRVLKGKGGKGASKKGK